MSTYRSETPSPSSSGDKKRTLSNRQKECALMVCGLCLLAPLALGSVHPKTQSLWTLCCLLILFPFVQSRRGHHHPFSLPWLWGSLILIAGALFTLIPLPQSILSFISSPAAHEWKTLSLSIQGWSSLSLSPIHTLHWINQYWVWIWVAYMSYHFHSFRKPLLWCLSLLGPLLVLVSCFHTLFDLHTVYGLYQSIDRGKLHSMISGVINPNTTASICLLSMSVAVGMSTHWRLLIHSQPELSLKVQDAWKLEFCGLLSLIGIGWSGSRAAIICSFLVMAALLWRRYQVHSSLSSSLNQSSITQKYGLIIGGLCLSIGFLFFVYIYRGSLIEHTNLAQNDSFLLDSATQTRRPYLQYPRFQTWSDTLSLIKYYGFWGSGRGSFGETFTPFQTFLHPGWVSHPENHILQHLSEAGFIGLIGGVIWPILFWFLWIRRAWQKAHDTAWGLWLGVGGVSLHQCFDFGFEALGLSIPVGIAWGLMWSYLSPSIKQSRQRRQRPKLIVFRLLCLACLLGTWATLSLTYRTLNESLLIQENQQSSFNEAELANLLKYHPKGGFLVFNVARLLYQTGGDALPWINHSQRLMPQHGESYQLEAHYYKDLKVYDLAQHSFRVALKHMPWKRRLIYRELNQLPLSPFNVLPKEKRGDFIYSLSKEVSLEKLENRILELSNDEWQADLQLRRFMINRARKTCSFKNFDHYQTLKGSDIISLESQLDQLILEIIKAVCAKQKNKAHQLLEAAPQHLKMLPLYSKIATFID